RQPAGGSGPFDLLDRMSRASERRSAGLVSRSRWSRSVHRKAPSVSEQGMSTRDQQGDQPLTRKQLREIRLTGATPVIGEEEAAAAAKTARPTPTTAVPKPAAPVEVPPAPVEAVAAES